MLGRTTAAGLVFLALAGPAPAAVTGWLTYGNDDSRIGFVPDGVTDPGSLLEVWASHLDGRITGQILAVRDVPEPGQLTLYVGTSKGVLYALNENGFERARRQLGFMRMKNCEFLPDGEFGITGTPAIDPRTATLFVTDALGYAHALDLVTLEERPGWPVRLYEDSWARLTWGAVTIVKGRLYVATGELCRHDVASGKVFRVDIRRRAVRSWTPTPALAGGGSGIWGWGGPAYDARTDSLLVATGDAYLYGKNRGKSFTESAGLAEHVVQLDRNLEVQASQSPVDYREPRDADFSGTPIVMRAPGCPALVAGENKNGVVYVWRLNRIGSGLFGSIKLAAKLNGQPAWSPRTRSLYVGGHDSLYRLALTKRCALRRAWSVPLGVGTVNGPPMIAGDVVWLPVTDGYAVWAVDARSGRVLGKLSLGEPIYAAPTILDGRVYAGGFAGVVKSFG